MDRGRRLTFGGVAELYDQVRPAYPAELVQDIIALAPLDGDAPRALEVGAGTGKATAMFAQRGLSIRALEPSAEMAAIAERNLDGFGTVTIDRTDFEQWDPRGETFPLLYAAQAWHWIAPDTGYAKARSVLEAGGLLAAFWNRPDWESSPVRAGLDEAYRCAIPERTADDPMHPAAGNAPDMWVGWERAITAQDGLERPQLRRYTWTQDYSTADYLGLLRTHSPNIVLEPRQRDTLLRAVGDVLDSHGGGLAMSYVTWLYLAWAC